MPFLLTAITARSNSSSLATWLDKGTSSNSIGARTHLKELFIHVDRTSKRCAMNLIAALTCSISSGPTPSPWINVTVYFPPYAVLHGVPNWKETKEIYQWEFWPERTYIRRDRPLKRNNEGSDCPLDSFFQNRMHFSIKWRIFLLKIDLRRRIVRENKQERTSIKRK